MTTAKTTKTTAAKKTTTRAAAAPKAPVKTAEAAPVAANKAAESAAKTAAAAPAAAMKSAENATKAAEKAVQQVSKAAEATTTQIAANTEKAAEKTREIVKRSSAAAKEQSTSAYENVMKFNGGLEKTMNRFVMGYVGILSDVAGATHTSFMKTVDAVERVAQAKTVSEAASIQAEFVQETMTRNLEGARNIASATSDIMNESAEVLRESVSGAMRMGRKGA